MGVADQLSDVDAPFAAVQVGSVAEGLGPVPAPCQPSAMSRANEAGFVAANQRMPPA